MIHRKKCFPQKGLKICRVLCSNQTARDFGGKHVKSFAFSEKTCFPKQNARDNGRQAGPLRQNPRDLWRLGRALLGHMPTPALG